jgi:hypothetical protein
VLRSYPRGCVDVQVVALTIADVDGGEDMEDVQACVEERAPLLVPRVVELGEQLD